MAEGGFFERIVGEAEEGEANELPGGALDPAAAAAAMRRAGEDAGLEGEAAAYFRKQTKLIEIQTEHLHEQRGLQLAHLRVRRWRDRLSLTLQGLGVAVVLLAVAALGVLGWRAHEDHGIVVQTFTAPPAFAARGVTGETVASDVMGKLSSIADLIREASFSSTGEVTADRSEDVKIEIPETGVSLSEAWRLLREWLGSARKLTGSLRDEGDGRVTLKARLEDGAVYSATGPASDLDGLEQKIAEQVYGATDPNNLAVYLELNGRKADAFAAAARYAALARTREDRANAVVMWGDPSDDPARQLRSGLLALKLDPGLMSAEYNIVNGALALEHPQEALAHARATLTDRPEDQPPQHRGAGARHLLLYARLAVDQLGGAYLEAEKTREELLPASSDRPELLIRNAVDAAWLHDPSASFDMIAEAQIFGATEAGLEQVARYWAEAARGDWPAASAQARSLASADEKALAESKDPDAAAGLKAKLDRRDRPMLALAEAQTGDLGTAAALAASTPTDCDVCLRTRGRIAALAGNPAESERWFAEAIRQNPLIPFAYADRGRTRYDRGEIAGALSDAETATRLGPRYADALKLLGDARARQGRWAEAQATYDAALAEAPAWTALKQARNAASARAKGT